MNDCCSTTKKPKNWGAYRPVLAIAALAVLGGVALMAAGLNFMLAFMGLWFLMFGLVKFFDPRGFVNAFTQYDMLAKKVPFYAWAYPFIEVGLGLCFLAQFAPAPLLVFTILFALLTLVGIAVQLRSGVAVNCACVGSAVQVPLGWVAVVENAAMILMSIIMLLF